MDTIGVSEECIHSIKSKKLAVMVIKVDLKKEYDRVDWCYLRIILIEINLPLLVVDWIMGCVTLASFLVLVNGIPSCFFKSSRVLRHGCPFSPLLFSSGGRSEQTHHLG